MNMFTVNGQTRALPAERIHSFQDLIDYLRNAYINETSIISGIRINGVEINTTEEEAMALMSIADIETVEVSTTHPKEAAEETLQSLIEFARVLANLSFQAGLELDQPEGAASFARLVDGIKTMMDAIHHCKQILRIAMLQPVAVLEADILSILRDVLEAQESGNRVYLEQLLREHLPTNLEGWQRDGIPALIRARDS